MKTTVLLSFTLSAIFLSSCRDCKTCYFIEEIDGEVASETEMDEYCGDEIEEQEDKVYTVQDGEAYVECR